MATIKVASTGIAGKLDTLVAGDKVIITDNAYNIYDINSIFTITEVTIKLDKTAAETVFIDSVSNLNSVLGKVDSYTGAVVANNANVTALELNELAGLTSGAVTATLNAADVDSNFVKSLSNVNSKDKISFKATDTDTDTAATDIVALKKILPSADFSAIANITGIAYNIADIKSAANIVKTADVTVTGSISAADANAIAKATTGAVEANVTGTAAALNATLKDLGTAGLDNLTLTVTDKIAKAADLKALDSKTSLAVDASLVETITGNAADVKAVLAASVTVPSPTITLGATPAITVTGTILASDAYIIANNPNAGVVTANVVPGTASSLNIALGTTLGGADKLGLTVLSESDGSATAASHLVDLNGKTASKIKVDAKEISGVADDLTDIYVTSKADFTGLGNEAVTITVAANADKVNAILKATTGVVTATLTGTATDLKTALTDAKATDALTLTVTGGAGTTAAAADLKALDAKTNIAVNASTVATITGNAADVKTVLAATGINKSATVAVTIDPTTKISAADANTITAKAGVVTAEVTAGTAAALNATLKEVSNTNLLTLTVTGATAAATDLNGLNTKTGVVVDATAVKTITGNVADISTAVGTQLEVDTDVAVNATVSGKVSLAGGTFATLLDGIAGKVTATLESGTAATLAATLATKGASTDALTINVVEDTVATDAANLILLDGQTSVKVKVDATQITGTYDQLKAVYVDATKAGFSNLGNEAVAITGVTKSATEVNSILKATTGAVTATVTDATARDLVANLKDANATDVLALTVLTGTDAKASELNILDGKTSSDIIVTGVNITGNIADVTKVFVTNAANFTGEENNTVNISGTVSAAQADAIANKTTAAVTATTITADTAANLDAALNDANGGTNAYTLTVSGTTADAGDLSSLNGKTTVDVNAAAIKTVTGDSADIATLYNDTTGVSGLGNEAVTVTNSDALVSEIASINADTTGVINVATVNTDTAVAPNSFNLSSALGDLTQITGLYHLDTVDSKVTTITLSLNDLLAANDSKTNFDFSIVGDIAGTDTVAFTTTGWTQKVVVADTQYTFTNDTSHQVITVNLDHVLAV